jgi:hypothetical protein
MKCAQPLCQRHAEVLVARDDDVLEVLCAHDALGALMGGDVAVRMLPNRPEQRRPA